MVPSPRVISFIAASLFAVGPHASAAPPAPSPRPLVLPWTFAPELEGAEATVTHAAGLGFLDGFELAVGFTERLSGDDPVASVAGMGAFRLGPLALGVSVAGIGNGPEVGGTTTRVDVSFALRILPTFALGMQWHELNSPELEGYDTWAASATLRPWRALALSLAVERFDSPMIPHGFAEDPIARLGIGIRPGSERITFGVEAARTLNGGAGTWQALATTRAMLIPGLALGGYVQFEGDEEGNEQRLSGGVFLGLYQGGFGLESGFDASDASGSPMRVSALLRAGGVKRPSLVPGRQQVYHLKLSGELPERPTESIFGSPRPGFAHWLMALDMVARDPRVAGLVLQIDEAPSWAQCWELRQAMARIRQAGKKVIALETMGDMRAHYLASAADEVHLYAAGGLLLTGLAITQTYYLGLMDKLGIRAEFVKYDEYKSAPEPFTRTSPSEPAAEQVRGVLDGVTVEWLTAVGRGRKLDESTLRGLLESGPHSMHSARSEGLVDGLVEADALGELVEATFGPEVALVDRYRPPVEGWPRWGKRDKIAILPVTGSIVDGSSAGKSPLPIPFIGGETTGDASFVQALERALKDPDVVGIVVRVDSGGGSAVASDRMHRALMGAQKRKPVVVSFGDVAASGGYYLAAGSPILSTPVTITGSIGIFTGKVDLTGMYALLGLTTHTQKSNERADMMSPYRAMTEAERDSARRTLKAYYDRFLGVVASGRKMERDEVEAIARGRVWLGTDALDKKLVDDHGGLWDAIEKIRVMAGIGFDERVDLEYFGTLGPLSSLQRFISGVFSFADVIDEQAAQAVSLPPDLAELAEVYSALASKGPLAMMPYTVHIE